MPKDKHRFNSVFVVINQLSKELITTLCHKTATAKDMAYMFITNVYYYKGALETIVLDRGLQFILKF
jgi:hypothetical protein